MPRIEFEGAVYHVMARGDRREPIVFSDEDRKTFSQTLAQACERTGWEVFAWVLMENHYHVAMRTPEPNLVEGMRWFQNAFTRRINTRNRLWGHLFGGRYKSILVEDEVKESSRRQSEYLTTLIDYIHLNPVRAGLVDGVETSLAEYPWSSVALAYRHPRTKRPGWVAVEEGLDLLGEKDTARGRRRYIERLDQWAVAEERERAGLIEKEGQSLQSTLRRGWYWGSEAFREKLVATAGKQVSQARDRELRSSGLFKSHDQNGVEAILEDAKRHFGVSIEAMARGGYRDLRRVALAWALFRKTTIRQGAIAEMLGLKSAANVSQRIKRFEETKIGELSKELKGWREKYSK